MRKYSPLLELTRARLMEFFREPGALFWVFGFPLLLALALGFAFRDKPPDKTPIGVVGSTRSAQLATALSQNPALKVESFASLDAANAALRNGKVSLLVESGGTITYRYDPTRPDSRAARLEVNASLQKAGGRKDPVATADQLVHEKGSRYIDFLIPGILGLNLMGTGMWGVGFSIVTARIKKTLKLLSATPMRRRDYLLCHILARLAFLCFEVPLILCFGVFVFGVPIRGSLLELVAVCVLGAIVFSGIGLLTTSRARTIETASGLMNLVMIPMWLLSGSFFSAERFPAVMQPFIQALPLTPLNNILRAIMLEGKSLTALPGELAILAGWGIASFLISLKIFRWQ